MEKNEFNVSRIYVTINFGIVQTVKLEKAVELDETFYTFESTAKVSQI